MTNRLFVYGTLAPGRPNEHVFAEIPGRWEAATVKGKLVEHLPRLDVFEGNGYERVENHSANLCRNFKS
jgi:gamma-glutamylcyclotransferase (GGCT)/AIG2-like uncharacterized protein YtfP